MSWQSFTVSISTDSSRLSYSPHQQFWAMKKNIQTGKPQKKQSPSPPSTRHILPPQNKRPTCSLLKICDGVILAPEIFHSGARIYIGKEKRKGRLLSALFSIVIVGVLNIAVLDLNSCLDRCFLHDWIQTTLIPTISLAPKHSLWAQKKALGVRSLA